MGSPHVPPKLRIRMGRAPACSAVPPMALAVSWQEAVDGSKLSSMSKGHCCTQRSHAALCKHAGDGCVSSQAFNGATVLCRPHGYVTSTSCGSNLIPATSTLRSLKPHDKAYPSNARSPQCRQRACSGTSRKSSLHAHTSEVTDVHRRQQTGCGYGSTRGDSTSDSMQPTLRHWKTWIKIKRSVILFNN